MWPELPRFDGKYPACWLAWYGVHETGTMPPCNGRLVKAHLLPRQLLKREGHADAVDDPRSWVMACGGIMGNGGHHGMLDQSRSLRIPFDRLPGGTLALAGALELMWWVEREYTLSKIDGAE